MAAKCVASGCICCYDAYDCDNIVCCANGTCDCICIRHACCFAFNSKHRGCGMTTDKDNDEICKIGLFCCDLGLISPTKLCAYGTACLCCYEAGSFPFDKEYVGEPVCAFCFIQVAPECGCCVRPPDCPVLENIARGESMERN